MKFYNPFKAHIRQVDEVFYAVARINIWWPFGFSYLSFTGGKFYWWWFDEYIRKYTRLVDCTDAKNLLALFKLGENKVKSKYIG